MKIKQLNPQVLEAKLTQLNRHDVDEVSGSSSAYLPQSRSRWVEFADADHLPSEAHGHKQRHEKYRQQLHQLAEKMTFKLLLKRVFRR